MRKYGFLEKNFFYISKNIVNEITLIHQIAHSFYKRMCYFSSLFSKK